MTEQTENLLLEILRRLQADMSAVRADVSDIKVRQTLMEQSIAGLYGLYATLSGRNDRIERRLERIDRRLELRKDTPTPPPPG